ncbi:heme peroxidase [Cristinia sonorae]|uniref:Peroxidase n=1 Tax=Cristinia sonorae TaxID=1940300 RepID=A0A8K0US59_9AGAR|nr:heme peroxidase [Cristinia sonorae]
MKTSTRTTWTVLLTHVFTFTLFADSVVVKADKYPDPLVYELDHNLYDREGYGKTLLSATVLQNCSFFSFGAGGNSGRNNAADWIRTAFHDMATYNVMDGTGGLDASIRFSAEMSRAENPGDGFQNTLTFIAPVSVRRYFSMADNIAMAAVTGFELCGGPKIAYRGGRLDASEPNAPGVPEPQQGIEEHISNFARQGFTKEEMIGLVACGHSFGGVQHITFPDIVPPMNDPTNLSGNAKFDTTFEKFDNKIATEYIDGTTKNPLVVGHNDTTNSDLRIFSSDGNRTMARFSKNPAVFRNTCAELFARMIDTVPKGVTLTQVIKPIEVKPDGFGLVWVGNGKIAVKGELRLWDTPIPPEVTMKWKARDKKGPEFSVPLSHNVTHVTFPHIPDTPGLQSRWYDLPQPLFLNANESISTFWFEIKRSDSSTKVANLNGAGYSLQDVIMLSNSTSQFWNGKDMVWNMTFAVRADVKPSRIYFGFDTFVNGAPTVVEVDVSPSNATTTAAAAVDGYILWNTQFVRTRQMLSTYTVAAVVGDRTYETDPNVSLFVPVG